MVDDTVMKKHEDFLEVIYDTYLVSDVILGAQTEVHRCKRRRVASDCGESSSFPDASTAHRAPFPPPQNDGMFASVTYSAHRTGPTPE